MPLSSGTKAGWRTWSAMSPGYNEAYLAGVASNRSKWEVQVASLPGINKAPPHTQGHWTTLENPDFYNQPETTRNQSLSETEF